MGRIDAHDDFTANPSCGTRCGRAVTGECPQGGSARQGADRHRQTDKSIFLLRWFHDPELRGDGLQLNRGEHRQSLAKWLFFANQGEFREGD